MSTSTKQYINPNAEITLEMPYQDTMIGDHMVCPAEVFLKGYRDKVGGYIEFMGVRKKVLGVTVVNGNIQINLK